ncbi:MAG: hypothetical protein QG650_539 [Patescibacteria group bacterium]|nr:hypothetical protein [Patescibacteria group bacterium]
MYVLFLFIHLVFAAVFYFFDRFPEAVIFLILGAVFFFAFGPFDFKKKTAQPASLGVSKIASHARAHALSFFKTGTYYIGFLLFYLSLYGIAYSLSKSLGMTPKVLYGWLTLSLSVVTLSAFAFFGTKHDVAYKIFRSNAFVFSTLHFFFLVYRLFWGGKFDPIFVTNVVLSLGSLATVVFVGNYGDRRQRSSAYLFFLAYSYVCALSLAMRIFGFDSAKSALAILFLESVAVFDGLTRIRQLKEFRSIGAYAGLVISYLAVVGIFVYVAARNADAFIISLALAISAFQTYLHAKYENYVSLASVLALVGLLYFETFFPRVSEGFFPFLLFCFGFPAGVAVFAKWKTFHQFDRQFLFGSGILHVLACFAGYFFRFSAYSILEISLLSLGSSVLFFLSYLGMRPHSAVKR